MRIIYQPRQNRANEGKYDCIISITKLNTKNKDRKIQNMEIKISIKRYKFC